MLIDLYLSSYEENIEDEGPFYFYVSASSYFKFRIVFSQLEWSRFNSKY
jgi:hypothetical protein